MRKRGFKTIRLFLKLILLFQIYSHHCFKAEETENIYPENFYKVKIEEETVLDGQISDKDTGLSVVAERPNRPARLMPLKLLRYFV